MLEQNFQKVHSNRVCVRSAWLIEDQGKGCTDRVGTTSSWNQTVAGRTGHPGRPSCDHKREAETSHFLRSWLWKTKQYVLYPGFMHLPDPIIYVRRNSQHENCCHTIRNKICINCSWVITFVKVSQLPTRHLPDCFHHDCWYFHIIMHLLLIFYWYTTTSAVCEGLTQMSHCRNYNIIIHLELVVETKRTSRP